LTEALTLTRTKGPRFVVAAALDELGMLAVRQREAQRGVSLLAAAAALRRTMGTPVRPADRPVLESALAAARAALGDRSCDEAWAVGQGQPLEQVSARIVTALADAAGAAKRARVA
jgi:hypothetical protein